MGLFKSLLESANENKKYVQFSSDDTKLVIDTYKKIIDGYNHDKELLSMKNEMIDKYIKKVYNDYNDESIKKSRFSLKFTTKEFSKNSNAIVFDPIDYDTSNYYLDDVEDVAVAFASILRKIGTETCGVVNKQMKDGRLEYSSGEPEDGVIIFKKYKG